MGWDVGYGLLRVPSDAAGINIISTCRKRINFKFNLNLKLFVLPES